MNRRFSAGVLWPRRHPFPYNLPVRLTLPALMAVLLGEAACGGLAQDAPLTIQPGVSRAMAISELHELAYCRPAGPKRSLEVYPACDRPGAELGTSWVAVAYRDDRLVRLQRFEQYDDESVALERWNDLVRRRIVLDGAATAEARSHMLRLRGLPDGTRSWVAFYRSDRAVLVGVYLLAPKRLGDADLLEELISTDDSAGNWAGRDRDRRER